MYLPGAGRTALDDISNLGLSQIQGGYATAQQLCQQGIPNHDGLPPPPPPPPPPLPPQEQRPNIIYLHLGVAPPLPPPPLPPPQHVSKDYMPNGQPPVPKEATRPFPSPPPLPPPPPNLPAGHPHSNHNVHVAQPHSCPRWTPLSIPQQHTPRPSQSMQEPRRHSDGAGALPPSTGVPHYIGNAKHGPPHDLRRRCSGGEADLWKEIGARGGNKNQGSESERDICVDERKLANESRVTESFKLSPDSVHKNCERSKIDEGRQGGRSQHRRPRSPERKARQQSMPHARSSVDNNHCRGNSPYACDLSLPPTPAAVKEKRVPVEEVRSNHKKDVSETKAILDMDLRLAEISSKMQELQLGSKGPTAEEETEERNYLTLEEYKEAATKGLVGKYSGSKYKDVDKKYADGWALNPISHRWIKVAKQESKEGQSTKNLKIKLLCGRWQAKMDKMQEQMKTMAELAVEKAKLDEGKVERMIKASEVRIAAEVAKASKPSGTLLSKPTTPKLLVFDTNWLIHRLFDAQCYATFIAISCPDTSLLVPREVVRELDRLKTHPNQQLSKAARDANRFIVNLMNSPTSPGRKLSLVRGQEDTELFRDNGHHSAPGRLRADDAILNCCLFFARRVEDAPQVTLCSGDKNFLMRARVNGIETEDRVQCQPGSCENPVCPHTHTRRVTQPLR
ncbi:unnamed protein product [Discosporangium mesarthrocarpum]